MSKEERIAKLQWLLQLLAELESEGVNLPETKANVVNKINELSVC